MNGDIRGISAVSRSASASAAPIAVAAVRAVADATDQARADQTRADQARADQTRAGRQPVVPQQSIPSTAAALPVAETALRRVLAGQGQGGVENPTATALDLLRSVEALLRASAPAGTSAEEIGSAAARLVERQGLLARLSEGGAGSQPASQATLAAWDGSTTDGGAPNAVDTRL